MKILEDLIKFELNWFRHGGLPEHESLGLGLGAVQSMSEPGNV